LYPSIFDVDEINTEFVKKYQQHHPLYVDRKEGRICNFGSEKGVINIFNDARNKNTRHIHVSERPQIVLLNGVLIEPQLFRTDDTNQYWMRVNSKSFIDDLLRLKAIVLLDTNTQYLIRVQSLLRFDINSYDRHSGDIMELNQAYKCDIMPLDDVIRAYFPDGYSLSNDATGELESIVLYNNVARKLKEKAFAESELRKQAEAKEAQRKKSEEQAGKLRRQSEKERKYKEDLFKSVKVEAPHFVTANDSPRCAKCWNSCVEPEKGKKQCGTPYCKLYNTVISQVPKASRL